MKAFVLALALTSTASQLMDGPGNGVAKST